MNWLIVLLYTVALGDYIVSLLVIFINYSNDHYFVSFQIVVLSLFESILDRRNCCKSETFEKNRRDEDDYLIRDIIEKDKFSVWKIIF